MLLLNDINKKDFLPYFSRDILEFNHSYRNIPIFDNELIKWEPRKVGTNDSNSLNNSVRNSYKISEIFCFQKNKFIEVNDGYYLNIHHSEYTFNKDIDVIYKEFNELLIKTFGNEMKYEGLYNYIKLSPNYNKYSKIYNMEERKWYPHLYKTGGKFIKHSDTKINIDHIGTLVLIPPANISPYKGGELIIYNFNDDTIIDEIITPSNDGWQIAFIRIGQKHEVKEVLEGERYSFTSPYFQSIITKKYISSTIYTNKIDDSKMVVLSNSKKSNIIKNIDLQIKKLQDEKNKLISSFDTLDLNNNYITDIKSYIEYQDSFIVFCKNFYDNPSPDNLTFDDANIFNFLVENKKNVTFFNLSVIIDAGNSIEILDDNEWSNINDEYGHSVYDAEHTKFNNSFLNGKILKELSDKNNYGVLNELICYYLFDEQPGKFIYSDSEYNDEYYENTKEIMVTCMIINL